METHDDDPRDHGSDHVGSDEAWRQASQHFTALGDKLRTRYQEMVGDDGPAEEEVRQAFSTIGTAAQSLVDSIGESMRDPQVREQVKEATSTFFTAIGRTLSQLGDELRAATADEPDEPDA